MNEPLTTQFLGKNVACLRAALDHHNATCPEHATAFSLHPYDRRLLPFDDLWGIPLVEDATQPVKHFRVACPLKHDDADQPSLPGPEPQGGERNWS
jgi:hypothetical protein